MSFDQFSDQSYIYTAVSIRQLTIFCVDLSDLVEASSNKLVEVTCTRPFTASMIRRSTAR